MTMDADILKLLNELVKDGGTEPSSFNKLITQHFPQKEFLEGGPQKPKVFVRYFMKWACNTLTKKSLNKAFKLMDDLYIRIYENHTTRDAAYKSDIRTVIAKRFGDPSPEYTLVKKMCALTWEEKGALILRANQKVIENHTNQLSFDSDKIIALMKDNLNSADPFKRAVVLLIACGSRPIEMLVRANYTPNEKMGPHWVFQDHMAKKPGGVQDEEQLTKPLVYLTADQFITELAKLRLYFADKYKMVDQRDQLSPIISIPCNKAAKTLLEGQDKVTLYSCRKIYGIMSYELFSKTTDFYGKNPSHKLWVNRVLGHSKNSFKSSDNYSHIQLTSEPKSVGQLKIEVEILENKVEDLEERFEQETIPRVEVPKPAVTSPPPPTKPAQVAPSQRKSTKSALDKLIETEPKNLEVLKSQAAKLREIYDAHEKEHGIGPNLGRMEKLAKDRAPRAVIRMFMNSTT